MSGMIFTPDPLTIITDTNAYAAGDYIGTTILEVPNTIYLSGAVLHTVVLSDKSKQNAPIDLFFFRTACTNSTLTNNGALTINAADLVECIGHVPILATDYGSFATNSVATVPGKGLTFNTALSTRSLYMIPVCRGTPTYAASALQVKLAFLRE